MFYLKKKFSISFLIFSLLSIFSFPLHAEQFPENISANAIVSIISVNYADFSHSLFSKSCLRIYDKETSFDTIIDFAHFENFDDEFFGLKFFLQNKRAKIKSKQFFDFFLRESQKKTVTLSESVLSLSSEEVAYLYSFIKILHDALPNYEYEFDILTNNSETHISHILHDTIRMKGKENGERQLISEIRQHNLKLQKMYSDFALLNEPKIFEFNEQEIPNEFVAQDRFFLTLFLGILSILTFLITGYQLTACFYKKVYVSSIFKTIQIFDFMIFFIAGIFGTIILLLDFFSNQTLVQNNFRFMVLNPLHFFVAFIFFKPVKNAKIECAYWLVSASLSILYMLGVLFSQHKLPLVSLCFVLPFFLRTAYFGFTLLKQCFQSFFRNKTN